MAIEGRTGDLAAELNAGASADTVDRRQSSLLMHASAHGNLSTVELLLQHGASVHYVDPQRGRTALGAALYRGQATIVERLLRAGADPQAGQPSARDLAVQWKKADLLP
ncbi:hypothetical protein GA0111570_10963 [Raineyella antarctica]|uniref:Uncharacterized protein n=2 Tax=Raineyella antarctica TaxID=1577474 RepID=A0A1G6HEN3_9ACTN|nr:hypothetical protein GA0111570_10963 [Raineyella antarctica]